MYLCQYTPPGPARSTLVQENLKTALNQKEMIRDHLDLALQQLFRLQRVMLLLVNILRTRLNYDSKVYGNTG